MSDEVNEMNGRSGDTPLFKSGLHVLLALAEGDRHGYAIKQEVERLTGGEVRLGPGTLYEAIQRLEDRGLIEESSDRPDEDDRADRRYYRLTPAGRAALKAELRRAERLVAYGRVHRLLGPEKMR